MRKLPLLLIAAMLLFSACAEEEFPLAFLKIVGESLGGSEATPEGREDRRTSAQSIAAGTLIRSHGS